MKLNIEIVFDALSRKIPAQLRGVREKRGEKILPLCGLFGKIAVSYNGSINGAAVESNGGGTTMARKIPAQLRGVREKSLHLGRPEYYLGAERVFHAGRFYVLRSEQLPQRPVIEKGAAILCIGKSMYLPPTPPSRCRHNRCVPENENWRPGPEWGCRISSGCTAPFLESAPV